MALTRSLAVGGMLACVSVPALAAETWSIDLSALRARLAAVMATSSPTPVKPASAPVVAPTPAPAPAAPQAAPDIAATGQPATTTQKPVTTAPAPATPSPAPVARPTVTVVVAGVNTSGADWLGSLRSSLAASLKFASLPAPAPVPSPAPAAQPAGEPGIISAASAAVGEAVDAVVETVSAIVDAVQDAVAGFIEDVVGEAAAPEAAAPAQSDATAAAAAGVPAATTGLQTTPPPTAGAPTTYAGVITGDGTVYYVDFASGDDANAGTSPSKPWKRAPGDTAATGVPASKALAPGDTVRFKAGVAYRGTIVPKSSGADSSPIIYTGTGYGTGSAIWDGADPVISAVPCPSQSACGGATNWSSLRLVTYKEPTIKNRALYDALGPIYEAQSPLPADPFWDDDLDSFAVTPASAAAAIAGGRIDNAALAAAAAGQKNVRVAIWVQGNAVIERPVLSVSGSSVYFDGTGVKPYTDRDGRAAIVGSVKSVTRPGTYAVIGAGQAVVYPRSGGGGQYYVGTGRYAFELRGQSNITIHGFEFARQTASIGSTREGVGVANYGGRVRNIRIEQNLFRGASMQNGYGMVMLNNVDGLTVRDNRLVDIQSGSGLRFGGVTGLLVERNRMQRVGRTGIYLGGASNAIVRSNVMSNMFGVHGNGMSFYQANSNVEVSSNCVYNTTRPMTFHGDKNPSAVNDLRFTGNIFITSPNGTSAIYSWGAQTRKVLLQNNIALGSKAGMILNDSDIDVTVTRNRMSLFAVSGDQPPAWIVKDNIVKVPLSDSATATLTADSCSAKGYSGPLTVSAL
jgi:hypothetical protein